MLLSFAYTLEQFLLGKKRVTRRQWKGRHLKQWQRAWDNGRYVHDAWSNLPFVEGAIYCGPFGLTHRPYSERLGDMPESDLEAEGGLWSSKREFIEMFGGNPDLVVAVTRLEKIDVIFATGFQDHNFSIRTLYYKDVDPTIYIYDMLSDWEKEEVGEYHQTVNRWLPPCMDCMNDSQSRGDN